MIKAKLREDVREEYGCFIGINYETGMETIVEPTPEDTYECEQPDILDEQEHNLLIRTNNGILKVQSIDFDFHNE